MRAAIYARVSTSNGQSPDMQLHELGEFAERRGWKVIGEYVDSGISGSKEKRPALDRLMSDAHKRRFDCVVVYRYDRLARSLRHLVTALDTFNSLGIQFVSIHEGVDTSTPNGRLIFGIFASIAEFERELIRDRVKSGIAAARARGVRLGRPALRSFTPADVRQLRRDRRKGMSYATLAQQHHSSVFTVYRLLNVKK